MFRRVAADAVRFGGSAAELHSQLDAESEGILFATRNGLRPRSRDNVVKCGLKPVPRKLGIPTANTGLHAFRHGLATELAESAVPLTVLQNQLRHADVKTTLKNLRARHPAVTARCDGARRTPIITFRRYVTKVRC